MQRPKTARTTHKRNGAETGRRPRRSIWLGLLGLVLLIAALPSAAFGQAVVKAVNPGTQGEGNTSACFWGQPMSNIGPIDELNEQGANILSPDTNVSYWYTRFQMPVGSTITLHGQFPHSRFFSLTTYVTKGTESGIPSTSIYDSQINPDEGSINPFRSGESRKAKNRSYTITISAQPKPEAPEVAAANTLYAGQVGKTGETQQVEMIMRVYRADKGLNSDGGVPLPAPTFNPEGGSPISEEASACAALSDVSGILNLPTGSISVPEASYLHLRELAPAPHPAVNPILWERFRNTAYLQKPFLTGAGEPYEKAIAGLPTTITSGLYATPANAYMSAYADRDIGPNTEGHNILVLHAKMPTHPTTYLKDKINNGENTQVRYWSLCTGTSIAKPSIIRANSACLFDQEVPTNSNGEYTIVVSLPQDRPKNAKPGCGVAWLDWGTEGDGLEGALEAQRRPSLDLLVMRNQLSNPTFEQSIEKVITPGSEQEVMGAYYPHGKYMTTQEFESRKCWSASS
jgi:hypothetical protein